MIRWTATRMQTWTGVLPPFPARRRLWHAHIECHARHRVRGERDARQPAAAQGDLDGIAAARVGRHDDGEALGGRLVHEPRCLGTLFRRGGLGLGFRAALGDRWILIARARYFISNMTVINNTLYADDFAELTIAPSFYVTDRFSIDLSLRKLIGQYDDFRYSIGGSFHF